MFIMTADPRVIIVAGAAGGLGRAMVDAGVTATAGR